LYEQLVTSGIVAIEGIDTRALTLKIREGGAMRAALSTSDLDPAHLVDRVRASEHIADHNYVADVSAQAQQKAVTTTPRSTVVVYDCGEKQGIVEGLAQVGARCISVAWDVPADEALAAAEGPVDGVFFSNGPGDPLQVVATCTAARALLGRVPLFGICLGNQILSHAAGASIEKLLFGHHGGNEPVMNLLTGRVEITAQNHNYGFVWNEAFGPLVPELSGNETDHHSDDLRFWTKRHIAPVLMTRQFGRVRLTHVNLNDGTPEGLQFLDVPAFSVQYHPEACPGPHDSAYLFEAFARLMQAWRDAGGGALQAEEDEERRRQVGALSPLSTDYLAIDFLAGRHF
jgi:carbamoyl-phosphate synthase small subunit